MNSEGNDTTGRIDETYLELRHLSAQNPREARRSLENLIAGDPDLLNGLLLRMAAPGEGRVRQLMANFARANKMVTPFMNNFRAWLAVETDEFAKRAVEAAFEVVSSDGQEHTMLQQLVPEGLLEMYRYVSERMRHELQNALLGPRARLIEIRGLLQRPGELPLGELQTLIGQLRDGFQTLGQLAEFEPDGEYFAVRPITLLDWIEKMNMLYGRRYERIDLTINSGQGEPRVQASDYLLTLIFWNLWINAQQAVGNSCSISLQCTTADNLLSIVVIDNGPGFDAELVHSAFQDRFSIAGPHRGRGLLEIQDAISRLHGHAQLVALQTNEYRVRLDFPTI